MFSRAPEAASAKTGISTIVNHRRTCVATDAYYKGGFAQTRPVVVARYAAPAKGQSAFGWASGQVTLDGGNLGGPQTTEFQVVNGKVQVGDGDIEGLSLTLTASSGLVTGKFTHPVTGRSTTFKGVVVQDANGVFSLGSGGWFLGSSQAGGVRVEPVLSGPP